MTVEVWLGATVEIDQVRVDVRAIGERLEHTLAYSSEFGEDGESWYWTVRYYYAGQCYSAAGAAPTESEARKAREKAVFSAVGAAVRVEAQ